MCKVLQMESSHNVFSLVLFDKKNITHIYLKVYKLTNGQINKIFYIKKYMNAKNKQKMSFRVYSIAILKHLNIIVDK